MYICTCTCISICTTRAQDMQVRVDYMITTLAQHVHHGKKLLIIIIMYYTINMYMLMMMYILMC